MSHLQDKYIIGDECRKYVMTTMRDLFRGHKARIKRDHYYKYATDEERLENRPREIPLADFKMLLGYWADEKIVVKFMPLFYTFMHPAFILHIISSFYACLYFRKKRREIQIPESV